jgi:hypothetical protein
LRQLQHFFPPSDFSVLQNSDGKRIEELIHHKDSEGKFLPLLLILIVLLQQIFNLGEPAQFDILELILADELLPEIGSILIVEAEEGLVLLELIHHVLLLLLAIVLRN